MSNPRSSKRTSARIATFHVDDEIEISSSLLQNDSLDDRVSGAGPPALSLERTNADLAQHTGAWFFYFYLLPMLSLLSTLPTFDAYRPIE